MRGKLQCIAPCTNIYNELSLSCLSCLIYSVRFLNLNNVIVLGCFFFTIHNPTIYGLTMYDSCVNYPNYIKIYKENYKTGKLNFTEQNSEFLLYANKHFSVTSRGI